MVDEKLDKDLDTIAEVLGADFAETLNDGLGDDFDNKFIHDLAIASKSLLARRGEDYDDDEEGDDDDFDDEDEDYEDEDDDDD